MEPARHEAPTVVYEDNHLIAIVKPFGMPSQWDDSEDQPADEWVREYLRQKYDKPGNVYVGLLHRLDRPAGGLLLLAKTSKAAERMTLQFKQRAIEKTYLVGTMKVPNPKAARLQDYVGPMPGQPHIMRAYDSAGADRKLAALEYRVVAEHAGQALLEVQLETGRKHQIRVQFAKIGCGVIGDGRYQRTTFLADMSIALFSWKMRFEHPVRKGEWLNLEAPLPVSDLPFGKLLQGLGK